MKDALQEERDLSQRQPYLYKEGSVTKDGQGPSKP